MLTDEAAEPVASLESLAEGIVAVGPHIVGVTFRPVRGKAQAIAGIAGGAAIVLAGLGLVRRRTADRERAVG